MHASRLASSRLPSLVAFGFIALAGPAFADTPERVRGTVVGLENNVLIVKSREGANVAIKLADGWSVNGVVSAKLGDIKPGDFIGVASVPDKSDVDGLEALELVIFPEALRRAGEGHRDWDLAPGSKMTNATVATKVAGVKGETLTLSYKGGERKIAVPAGTPVVTFAPAAAADLKPGAAVFVPALKKDDGSVLTSRVLVGKDGVVPPM